MEKRIALITGATSGFGKAIALRLAREGWDTIITGRRENLLNELAGFIKIQTTQSVLPLCFDVRNAAEVETSIAAIPEGWKKIDLLVNNAGLALGREPLDEGHTADWEQMIDTNVKGLLYVSKAVIPLMKTRGSGHIINIGSIAGREVYAGGNVYCATKFAVDALTGSMRLDLVSHGIRVSQVAPGAAETEFSLVRFKGDARKAKVVYEGFVPLSADDVADAVHYIASRPAHVSIHDLVIMPAAQASSTVIQRHRNP